jgi:hypothetical protein
VPGRIERENLGEADVVAGGVPEGRVDPIGLRGGRVVERDPAFREFLVAGLAVVSLEEERPTLVRKRAAARSRRRVRRYWWGDSPKVAVNWWLKCERDMLAAAARVATVSASEYRALTRSLARSR